MEADEKKCPQCAETIQSEAKICRFCGHSFENIASSEQGDSSLPDKKPGQGKGCLIALGTLVALGIFGSLLSSGSDPTPSANMVASENVGEATSKLSKANSDDNQGATASEASETRSNVGLFGPRANAARSAQQYLNMTGFSREGLIEQLSSGAGDGYSIADATAAVDSLTVDWNEQAVRSAKQYLDMTGFSCSGLVEQLSSDAGSKYTKAQARYGAEQAGAC